jgi:hypothetical protein
MAQCKGKVADAIQIPRLNDSGAPQLLHIGDVNAGRQLTTCSNACQPCLRLSKEIFQCPAAAIGIVTL